MSRRKWTVVFDLDGSLETPYFDKEDAKKAKAWMKRIALVVLIALIGSCSIFAAPTNEWRMPERRVVSESRTRLAEADDIVLSAAENPVESKNHVVMNQPVSGSAKAKPSAQADEGWKWNGWKIAAVVFFVLGIMGVVGVQLGWVMPSGNMGLVSSIPCVHLTMSLFLMSGLLFGFSYAPTVGKIFVYGVGGLFLLLFLTALIETAETTKREKRESDSGAIEEPDESIIPCLDAGPNGEIRRKLQMEQQPLYLEKAKCRLYVPKDWDPDVWILKGSEVGLEVDEDMTCDAITVLAGPREHEWITICHDVDHGSGPGVLVEEIMDVKMVDILMDGIMLIPHPEKAAGVCSAKRIAWKNAYLCDSRYLKFHQVDDNATDVRMGAFEIEGRLYRIISVAFARKNDCWRFEYAFPAADGVTPESLELRTEEIEAARRIFVPIETFP